MATLLQRGDSISLRAILGARELPPSVADWAAWMFRERAGSTDVANATLNRLAQESSGDSTLGVNLGHLCARLASESISHDQDLHGITFVGDSCASRRYQNVTFNRCRFWAADWSASRFENCSFLDCIVDDLKLSSATRLNGSTMDEATRIGAVTVDESPLYAPADVLSALSQLCSTQSA
jgi:hypothetical protein